MLRPGQFIWAAVTAALLSTLAVGARAQGPLRDGFEATEVAWREAGSDVPIRIEVHERTVRESHTGAASELIQFTTGGNGTHVYLAYNVGQAIVIPELTPSLWVRSDRAGIQLLARVVLPRARNPRTGEPLTTVIGGSSYTRVGSWESLQIGDVPTLLGRQARVLRAQLQSDVDVGEAYIDRLLLNVYTGAGRTSVWIDDLEMRGFVGSQPAGPALADPAAPRTIDSLPEPGLKRSVELNGSVLLAEGRPFFPRLLEYRGEPLSFVKQMGFNGIYLDTFPTPELVAQATAERLWMVCPPPKPEGLENPQAALAPAAEFATTAGVVLAWHLGSQLTGRDVEVTKRWSDYVRRFDRGSGRPLLAEAETDLRIYSRYADMLVLNRQPLGTSFELNDYSTWLRERPKLARPGTPFWAVVQTQLAPALREQCAGFSNGRAPSPIVGIESIRLLAYHALAAGSRGLLFNSQTRLDAQDGITRQRAMGLELLNYELDAIEPWGATGNLVATAPVTTAQVPTPGTTLVRSRDPNLKFLDYALPPLPDLQVALLQTERARLLMPLWTGKGAQYVPSQLAASGASFVVPGLPEANDVYRLTPAGMPPARHARVTGGIRVSLDELSATTMLIVTQDAIVMNALLRRTAERGARMVQLQRELMQAEFERTIQVDQQLASQGHAAAQSQQYIATAQRELQKAESMASNFNVPGAFAAGTDLATTYEQARRVLRPLQLLQRTHWDAAVSNLGSPMVAPLAANYMTLPVQYSFNEQIGRLRLGPNQLVGGDFDDLNHTLQSGWQHYEHPQEGVLSKAEFSTDTRAKQKSRRCLHLSAWPATDRGAAGLVESPPLWITSPAVQVQAGQWLRISGYLFTRKPISGSLDGVMIIDSIGGEALAERIGEAASWRSFTLYRFVPTTGPFTLTVALTGLGDAWLDDITIETVLPPSANPPAVPPVGRSPAAAETPRSASSLIRLPFVR